MYITILFIDLHYIATFYRSKINFRYINSLININLIINSTCNQQSSILSFTKMSAFVKCKSLQTDLLGLMINVITFSQLGSHNWISFKTGGSSYMSGFILHKISPGSLFLTFIILSYSGIGFHGSKLGSRSVLSPVNQTTGVAVRRATGKLQRVSHHWPMCVGFTHSRESQQHCKTQTQPMKALCR